jgi:hypothetical protein
VACGKDKSGLAEKPKQGGKQRAAFEEEDAKQPEKIRMVLDKDTHNAKAYNGCRG